MDEKTAIQARTGSIRCCRCPPAASSGTVLNTIATGPFLCLLRWDVKTGQVHGITAGRHTSQEFISFLEGLEPKQYNRCYEGT